MLTATTSSARRAWSCGVLMLCLALHFVPSIATASQKASLSINPVPTVAEPKVRTPLVSWTTGSGAPGEVVVSTSDGIQRLFARGNAGASEAAFIQPGVAYTFRLFQTAPERRVLATVRLGADAPKTSDIQPAAKRPAETSEAVNVAMVGAVWIGLAALVALSAAALRSEARSA